MHVLSSARKAARLTPENRNRAADFYRVVAICFVVVGHWTLIAPYAPQGELELRNTLAEYQWAQYFTWVFQVMPVFFFVGGYSNAASWTSARRTVAKRQVWATGRLRRLLVPVVPLVLVWSFAAAVAYWLGVDSDLVQNASRAALIPVWFLAVYIMVTLVVPVSYAVWEKWGLWSVTHLALSAVCIDLIGVGMGQHWLRWANYAPVWLGVHQLGYWWWRGDIKTAHIWALIALGVFWLSLLMGPANYPLSMVSVPGEAFSNTRPPTTAMLALGAVQIGMLLLVEKPISNWLTRETAWAVVILAAQRIMTVYLWHLSIVIAVIGLSLAIGGVGIRTEPGTVLWWGVRPAWTLTLVFCLAPVVLLFGRFEHVARFKATQPVASIQSSAGAVATCIGLTILALNGIGLKGAPGVNWISLLLILFGIGLAINPINFGKNSR